MPAPRAIPLLRRLGLALATLVISALLFRGAVASSLVTRGDGEFQSGNLPSAMKFYRRALIFDPTSEVGVERFTTIAMASGNMKLKAEAIDIAAIELARNPSDVRVRSNRAVMLQRLKRYDEAYRDFVILAKLSPNPSIVEFVARLALRRGDIATARTAYIRTLQIDPTRTSARLALTQLDKQHG